MIFYDLCGHISFIVESQPKKFLFSQDAINKKANSVNLLDQSFSFNFLDHMPKNFNITTNNRSFLFNADILSDTSPIIADFIQKNQSKLQYHLDIDDERNIFNKLELLYQGKSVIFEKEDYPTLSQIINSLKITAIPIDQLLNIDDFYILHDNNQISKQTGACFKISKDGFNHYLITTAPRTFTITTNKRDYNCNIFGILTSKIIRDFISKNPNSNHFYFDFLDENDEFLLITELFNFEVVEITFENIEIINKIVNDLQIECIINEIQKIGNEMEKFNETLDDQQEFVDSIEELFDWLYHIDQLTVEKVVFLIEQSIWIQTEENVKELSSFIILVINSDFKLHKYLLELIIELNKKADNNSNKLNILIHSIVDNLMLSFASTKCNCSFVYLLQKSGIIEMEEIKKKIVFYSNNNVDKFILRNIELWFLPEINEISQNFIFFRRFKELSLDELNFVSYFNKNIDSYIQMRDKGEPDDEITKAIRCDAIDCLRSLISSKIDDVNNFFIPFNIFENYVDFDQNKISYIDYAAAYGSIKCFKYLLLNHNMIGEATLSYAVYGGNIEIIRIVDQRFSSNKVHYGYFISYDYIYLSIIKHRNDVFNWIFEQKYLSNSFPDEYNNSLVYLSVLTGNAHALIQLVDNGFDFSRNPNCCYIFCQAASRRGFYRMNKLLLLLMNVNLRISKRDEMKYYDEFFSYNTNAPFKIQPKEKEEDSFINALNQNSFLKMNNVISTLVRFDLNENPIDSIDSFYFESSVLLGNLSIFKLYEKLMNQNDLKNMFILSIENNHTSIISYFLNTIFKDDVQFNIYDIKKIVLSLIKSKNLELFKQIKNAFDKLNPNCFEEFEFYHEMLNCACLNNNIDAAKKIIDYILENIESDENEIRSKFTTSFMKAVFGGFSDICQYFFDKRIDLDFEIIFSDKKLFNSMNAEMIIFLYENVLFKYKRKLFMCVINEAIRKKNKKMIEFLFKNILPLGNNLIDAVNTHDIDIVNIVLKYNSKPSFINNFSSKEGTALHIAVLYNDIDIVKRLISLPGIDINKICYTYSTPLKIACDNNNSEIVDILIKEENIDVNVISNTGDSLLMNAIRRDDSVIAEMLIKHPKTNINNRNSNNQTALVLAVMLKQLNIIELLINDEKFDPEESLLDYSFFISSFISSQYLIASKLLDVNYFYFGEYSQIDCDFVNDTVLVKETILNNNDKIDLIINHSSFDKDKSHLSEALFCAIRNENIMIFKKLIKFANCNDDVFKSLPMIFSPQIKDNDQLIIDVFEINKKNGNFIDFSNLLQNRKSFFTSLLPNTKNINEIVNLLLENGADPNIPDQYGVYPLQHAININSKDFISTLISSNKIDFLTNIQIRNKKKEYVENLIDFDDQNNPKNAQTNDSKYKKYIHLVARADDSEILNLFLHNKSIDINATDDLGETPLMEACRCLKINNIKLLFSDDNLDYLHCNNKGEDALTIISKMYDVDDIKESPNDKNDYCMRIISLIK
ncbi:hypothetical protein M9Y10_005673 [Tritrichomonas musculus]|uniref:DUF3447 domain-containing protein n=1 Tax=Tritrichomonas musculus TaxID=1915356 RepID=A0ABR2JD79_9EUKA